VAERAAVGSLRQACSLFEQQMAFFPPLVKDYGDYPPAQNGLPYVMPAGSNKNRYRVYNPAAPQDMEYLRGYYVAPSNYVDRFSIYTIPYYVLGVCEVPLTNGGTTPIDGVPGAGTRTPRRDGSFEQAGRTLAPLFDTGKNAKGIVTLQEGPERVQLQDVHGVAYRFYHWEHGQAAGAQIGQVLSAADLNVPAIVGDPTEDASLRDAQDAIVAAGPNGVFGDEMTLPTWHPQYMDAATMASRLNISDSSNPAKLIDAAMSDNIVEVLHGK